jgi:hypothetical protein
LKICKKIWKGYEKYRRKISWIVKKKWKIWKKKSVE